MKPALEQLEHTHHCHFVVAKRTEDQGRIEVAVGPLGQSELQGWMVERRVDHCFWKQCQQEVNGKN